MKGFPIKRSSTSVRAVLCQTAPRLRPFVILLRTRRRWRWVWNIVEWFWQGKAEVLWENPVPLPLRPPWYLSWTDSGSHPGLRDESNLNYAFLKIWFVPRFKHASLLSRSACQCCTTGNRSVGVLSRIIGAWSGWVVDATPRRCTPWKEPWFSLWKKRGGRHGRSGRVWRS